MDYVYKKCKNTPVKYVIYNIDAGTYFKSFDSFCSYLVFSDNQNDIEFFSNKLIADSLCDFFKEYFFLNVVVKEV